MRISLLSILVGRTRFHALEDQYADFLASLVAYPIGVTIQPMFGPSDGATGNARVRELTNQLFHELDRRYTGCQQPRWLAHAQRFNGFGVVEKCSLNPHVHLLLSCRSKGDQESRSTFLLEVADNVTKDRPDPRDDHWQRATREYIRTHPWAHDRCWAPHESVVARFAGKATVMVQHILSENDTRRWAGYLTKAWGYSAASLAHRQAIPLHEAAFDWFELRDFFPPDPKPAARNWKRDPDGSMVWDFNWRIPGKGILK